MKSKALALFTATTFLATLGLAIQAAAQITQDQITTFDPPGSYGTIPASINPSGEIAGYYFGPTGPTAHGFVRDKDGTITSFDAPGAGPNGTIVVGINPSGEITGYFFDANYAVNHTTHGFVRDRDGTIVSFDAPNAGTDGTVPSSINPAGTIMGYYVDSAFLFHGFVRDKHGAITSFDAGPRLTVPKASTPVA